MSERLKVCLGLPRIILLIQILSSRSGEEVLNPMEVTALVQAVPESGEQLLCGLRSRILAVSKIKIESVQPNLMLPQQVLDLLRFRAGDLVNKGTECVPGCYTMSC